jgi:tetratricopeptide (TPR) repeat protein
VRRSPSNPKAQAHLGLVLAGASDAASSAEPTETSSKAGASPDEARIAARAEARMAYERALALDPRVAEAHFGLAVLALDPHRDRTIGSPPAPPGAISVRPEHVDEALPHLDRAMESDPTYAPPVELKARVLLHSGRAKGFLDSLQGRNSKDVAAWDLVVAGVVLEAAGKRDAAEALYRQALLLEPRSTPARARLAGDLPPIGGGAASSASAPPTATPPPP